MNDLYKKEKIEDAIKLLSENGYLVRRLTKGQIEDSRGCDEYYSSGKDMDCAECRCSCCIIQ